MKNAKVENRKIVKAAQPRRVAGVPVRSGVKAGSLRGLHAKKNIHGATTGSGSGLAGGPGLAGA